MACVTSRVIMLGTDQTFYVSGVQDTLSLAFIDNATVMMTLYRYDKTTLIPPVGQWPLTLSNVPGANGLYTTVLPANLQAVDNENGWAHIEISYDTHSTTIYVPVNFQTYDQSQLEWTSVDDLNNMFGRDNVFQWADLDNSEDQYSVAKRLAWAIRSATRDAIARLSGGPVNPAKLTGVPEPLRIAVTRMAGVLLYESRGVFDSADEMGVHRLRRHEELANKFFNKVAAGQIRLACHVRMSPGVVSRETLTGTPRKIWDTDPTDRPKLIK